MAWEGALGVVPPECDGCAVSPEFPTFEVDQSRVLPEVLDVHFRTPAVWPDIAALSTGTNVRRRRVHPSAFMTYMFPLPDMATQQRMVGVRHALNRVAAVGASLSTELDAMLPAVLEKAFRGAV
jgi:type I restriction enzyme S subunit